MYEIKVNDLKQIFLYLVLLFVVCSLIFVAIMNYFKVVIIMEYFTSIDDDKEPASKNKGFSFKLLHKA
jgi:hypothetical protein